MAEPSRRSARTSGKTGMCVNKECKNYRQSVTVDHGEFVCPECGKSLVPLKGGANPQKKMWISALIGVVVIAAAVAVYLISQGGSSEPQKFLLTLSLKLSKSRLWLLLIAFQPLLTLQ